jgi:transposase
MNITNVRKKSSPDLNSKQKLAMICWAMQYYDHVKERIIDGGMKEITDRFSLTKTTVQRIFQEYRDELKKDEIYPNLEPKSKKVCGVKSMLSDEMKENIIDLHFMTEGQSPIGLFIEQYQSEFGMTISRSAMDRYLKEIGASQKVIYLAPALSSKQRLQRMEFVLGLIEHRGHGSRQFKKEIRIHVDEKWFFVQELKKKVRYLPCEERPKEKTVIHKSHIEKIMFLAAIGRPETFVIDDVSHTWDGKIGIFPFVKWVPAKRNSKNRVAGTPVMEDVSVDSVAYHDMMTREDGLLPTLKRIAPYLKGSRIIIQHDGAKPHNGRGNLERLNEYGQLDGWDIFIDTQPPQSPDLNKCDLCFFHSMQRATNRLKAQNTSREKLLEAVVEAYNNYDVAILERIEGIQHEIYRRILADSGGNQFDMPHSGVRKRQREGEDPCDRAVPGELYNSAQVAYLALKDIL